MDFLNIIAKDIDEIMKDKKTTVIFLSTLIKPVADMISYKYPVVMQNYYRITDCHTDWDKHLSGPNSAEETIIDVWSLASCDEVWGGASNMLTFVACLNPKINIKMLPSIKQFRGA
jgi:hypothetical protein